MAIRDFARAVVTADPVERKRAHPAGRGVADPARCRRIVEGFANHEQPAVALSVRALPAYPEAPPRLRSGLVSLLAAEPARVRLGLARLEAHGGGGRPAERARGGFRGRMPSLGSRLPLMAAMNRPLENGSPDHRLECTAGARAAGGKDPDFMARTPENDA